MSRVSTYLATLIGLICIYFLVRSFAFPYSRTLRNAVVQGILIGFGLVFVASQVYARLKAKKVNGWITRFGLGEPGNIMLLRAAHAQLFPGPVNASQEAMYCGRTQMAPGGLKQIASPNNGVIVIGRVLLESGNDLSIAYDLSKQIQLTPLSGWRTG
jgi:hypothetical protein